MFIELSPEQQVAFKQWARDNYKPGADINAMWHPVVQYECQQIILRCLSQMMARYKIDLAPNAL